MLLSERVSKWRNRSPSERAVNAPQQRPRLMRGGCPPRIRAPGLTSVNLPRSPAFPYRRRHPPCWGLRRPFPCCHLGDGAARHCFWCDCQRSGLLPILVISSAVKVRLHDLNDSLCSQPGAFRHDEQVRRWVGQWFCPPNSVDLRTVGFASFAQLGQLVRPSHNHHT